MEGRVTTKAADKGCEEGNSTDGLVSEKARIKVPNTSAAEKRAIITPINRPFNLLGLLIIKNPPVVRVWAAPPVWLGFLMQMTPHRLNLCFLRALPPTYRPANEQKANRNQIVKLD